MCNGLHMPLHTTSLSWRVLALFPPMRSVELSEAQADIRSSFRPCVYIKHQQCSERPSPSVPAGFQTHYRSPVAPTQAQERHPGPEYPPSPITLGRRQPTGAPRSEIVPGDPHPRSPPLHVRLPCAARGRSRFDACAPCGPACAICVQFSHRP